MAATTITEFKARSCTKCGGHGFLSAFQHRKGGECFRCGASGVDPQMVEVTREMTDAEVLAALASIGLPVVMIETQRAETGDYLADLFLTEAEVANREAAMIGARAALAAA